MVLTVGRNVEPNPEQADQRSASPHHAWITEGHEIKKDRTEPGRWVWKKRMSHPFHCYVSHVPGQAVDFSAVVHVFFWLVKGMEVPDSRVAIILS